MVFTIIEWKPIEGMPKKRRVCDIKTNFAKKRADHRNTILKDWAKKLEDVIEQKVPEDYTSPFNIDKCIYCLLSNIGPTGDEFRPTTQRGRQNKINCVPCCGKCNSSKQDKCGSELISWIKKRCLYEQQQKIIKWYQENEKYLLIPLDTIDTKSKKTYEIMISELDDRLNKIYEDFS